MEQIDWTSFSRKIAVKESKQTLYDAWTIPAEIERWFLSSARFFDTAHQEKGKETAIIAGDTYKWMWHTYDIVEEGQVKAANGTDHLQFTFAGDCLVEVKLKELANSFTMVELTQSEIPEDDRSKVDIRLGCDSGWSFYLVNLKSIYEGGIDLRSKDSSHKGVFNG